MITSARFCQTLTAFFASALLAQLLAVASAETPEPFVDGPLLDLVAAMPEDSWIQANSNSFSSVWTPTELRPRVGLGTPEPARIIAAWSSFAWDSNRGDLILYGGGHANYSGNDVYRWRSRTLSWERASLPSQILNISGTLIFTAIDGPDSAPASAHTYDNAVFLPKADRYLNFGGAHYNTGGPYRRIREDNPLLTRNTGPYLFDPARSDPWKVGGSTGSHVQREGPFEDIVGGEMWENRDIYHHLAGQALPYSHVNGCSAISHESPSSDVVYVGARTGSSTSVDLYRYEIGDIGSPWTDTISKVGLRWVGPSGRTTCAYDPLSHMVLRTGDNNRPFVFWNLATAGPSNRDQIVEVTGSVLEFVEYLSAIGRNLQSCAMDYDQERGKFALWCGAGEVWWITPPSPLATTGWTVEQAGQVAGQIPPNNTGTGILGKWKYIPGYDVFIGLEHERDGNIWVYKPASWQDPRPDSDGDDVPDVIDNCLGIYNPDQRDTDGDGYGNRCDADLNNDGVVNFADLALFRQRFGTVDPDADFNGDGVVNFQDLAIFAQLFGKPPGPSALVPVNTPQQ